MLAQKDSLATEAFIMLAKATLVLASLAAELVFYEQAVSPRFWKEIAPDAYSYEPSSDTLEWLKEFLKPSVMEEAASSEN